MLLAIDVGNTTIHAGLFQGGTLEGEWRFATRSARTPDELGVLLLQFLATGGWGGADVEAVAVACVVPTMVSDITRGTSRHLGVAPFFIRPAVDSPLPIRYEKPGEVGADRIANAAAGVEIAGSPLVVVDFGTATTFDVVSADGAYLGGAIAPGVEVSLETLFARAARLPRVDLTAPGRAIGRTTEESMQSGIIHGYAGLVDRVNARIAAELGGAAKVLATGGLADIIVPHTETVQEVHPTLTLEGIRLIHSRRGG